MLSLAASACAHGRGERAAPGEAVGSAPTDVSALARDYLDAYFRWRPEDATAFGFPGADHAAVQDPSPAALAAWQAAEDGFLVRARALDAGALVGSPAAVEREIL